MMAAARSTDLEYCLGLLQKTGHAMKDKEEDEKSYNIRMAKLSEHLQNAIAPLAEKKLLRATESISRAQFLELIRASIWKTHLTEKYANQLYDISVDQTTRTMGVAEFLLTIAWLGSPTLAISEECAPVSAVIPFIHLMTQDLVIDGRVRHTPAIKKCYFAHMSRQMAEKTFAENNLSILLRLNEPSSRVDNGITTNFYRGICFTMPDKLGLNHVLAGTYDMKKNVMNISL